MILPRVLTFRGNNAWCHSIAEVRLRFGLIRHQDNPTFFNRKAQRVFNVQSFSSFVVPRSGMGDCGKIKDLAPTTPDLPRPGFFRFYYNIYPLAHSS